MATHHTGGEAQEDNDTDLSEQGDRSEKDSENRWKRATKQKILHSRAMQRVTGRKRGADVTPAKKVQPPPAHVQVITAKRTSDTVQQPPKHSQEQEDQQMFFQYTDPPTPGRQHHRSDHHTQSPGTTQQRRPDTSPKQTHATAGTVHREQPRHPGYSDPPHPPLQSMGYDHLQQRTTVVPNPHQPDHTYQEDEQEEDHRHGDPTSSDQQLRRLELENKRLKREKEMVENTMLEYEAQLAAKDEDISRMRKVRTGPLSAVLPVTSDQTKLEMSLVARDAEITQLAADKNLLEHELQELQTKYKCLVTEKDVATHQVDTVTRQWRTAQEMSDSMKEENRTLTEKLQRMEREKEGSLLEQQQKDRIKKLEDELRGMIALKRASEEALRKQVQNNQEHYEQLLHRVQETKEIEDKRLRQELLDVQAKLEQKRNQVTTLQQLVRQNNGSTATIDSVEGLSKEKERGRGCYGAVYEVRVNGFPCIAKRLHDILVGRKGMEPVGAEQRAGVISTFRKECNILSGLRHPNVVQFMGVHCGSDEADISLIMEYMHMDLEHCMETYPDIPLPYKTSILRDVAYGLAYLHSRNIIHRDLNAGNVLLTESLRAKIADLGVAKLFDRVTVMKHTRTLCPGAQDFMPPECFDKSPKYGTQLDIFSFGHLTIYLANQTAPVVADRTVVPDDVKEKQMQVGKRREALDQMSHQLGGSHHPLYSTVVQCLSDTPDQRPTSRDLVKRMEEICQQHPIPHKNTLETLTIVATLRSSSKEQKEVLKKMEQYNTQLKSSNQVLQSRLVATQSESSERQQRCVTLQQRCDTLQQEVELVRGQYRELEEKNVSSNQVLRTCYTDIQASLRQMETQLGPMKNTTHEAF